MHQAITSVGSIIQDYDTDKQFPAFGFGARFLNGNVSHAFALNGNDGKPECAYIDGILQAYRSIIRNVELYGPTNFAPIINRVAESVDCRWGPEAGLEVFMQIM